MADKNQNQLDAALQPVGAALDRWAWQRLQDSHPILAGALEVAIAQGAQPSEVRRYVIEHTHQTELAGFVEQAARWLADNP